MIVRERAAGGAWLAFDQWLRRQGWTAANGHLLETGRSWSAYERDGCRLVLLKYGYGDTPDLHARLWDLLTHCPPYSNAVVIDGGSGSTSAPFLMKWLASAEEIVLVCEPSRRPKGRDGDGARGVFGKPAVWAACFLLWRYAMIPDKAVRLWVADAVGCAELRESGAPGARPLFVETVEVPAASLAGPLLEAKDSTLFVLGKTHYSPPPLIGPAGLRRVRESLDCMIEKGRSRTDRHKLSNDLTLDLLALAVVQNGGSVPLTLDPVDFAFVQFLRFHEWLAGAAQLPDGKASARVCDQLAEQWTCAGNAPTVDSLCRGQDSYKALLVDDVHGTTDACFIVSSLWTTHCSVADQGLHVSPASTLDELDPLLSSSCGNLPDFVLLDLWLWQDQEKKVLLFEAARRALAEVGADLEDSALDPLKKLKANVPMMPWEEFGILPQLLHLLHRSLPVVLFSSSQQRSLVFALSGLPNVVDVSAKPSLTRYPEDTAPEAIAEAWKRWMSRLVPLIKVHRKWSEVRQQSAWKAIPGSEWFYPRLGHARGDEPVESGKDTERFLEIELSGDGHPLRWLCAKWLPLVQRGYYRAAMSAPWMYLRDVLGEVRLNAIAGQGAHNELRSLYRQYECAISNERQRTGKQVDADSLKVEDALEIIKLFVDLVSAWREKPKLRGSTR